jgi:hypothetical protein
VFDAINSAKTEAINHANGKDAALGLAVEARLKVYVKWALTKANTNKHAGLAGNLWAEMENRVVKGGT